MYNEGSRQYKWYVEHYVDPSESGFKEVIFEYSQTDEGLIVEFPEMKPNLISLTLKISTIK